MDLDPIYPTETCAQDDKQLILIDLFIISFYKLNAYYVAINH